MAAPPSMSVQGARPGIQAAPHALEARGGAPPVGCVRAWPAGLKGPGASTRRALHAAGPLPTTRPRPSVQCGAGIPTVPAFHPTPQEWAMGPIAYLEKIKPEAEKYGLAHIVPPPGACQLGACAESATHCRALVGATAGAHAASAAGCPAPWCRQLPFSCPTSGVRQLRSSCPKSSGVALRAPLRAALCSSCLCLRHFVTDPAPALPPALRPGWDPPFALERGTNGVSMESFRFQVRKQYTSHLCRRPAPPPPAPGTPGGSPRGGAAGGRYGGRNGGSSGSASPRAAAGEGQAKRHASQQEQPKQGQQPQGGGSQMDGRPAPAPAPAAAAAAAGAGEQRPPQPSMPPQRKPGSPRADAQAPPDFGFPHLVSMPRGALASPLNSQG